MRMSKISTLFRGHDTAYFRMQQLRPFGNLVLTKALGLKVAHKSCRQKYSVNQTQPHLIKLFVAGFNERSKTKSGLTAKNNLTFGKIDCMSLWLTCYFPWYFSYWAQCWLVCLCWSVSLRWHTGFITSGIGTSTPFLPQRVIQKKKLK